ncbi:hypothetical protein HDK77DRAFT_310272 [Phyllosticta capitalensis]
MTVRTARWLSTCARIIRAIYPWLPRFAFPSLLFPFLRSSISQRFSTSRPVRRDILSRWTTHQFFHLTYQPTIRPTYTSAPQKRRPYSAASPFDFARSRFFLTFSKSICLFFFFCLLLASLNGCKDLPPMLET